MNNNQLNSNQRLFQILSLLFSYPEEWLDFDILSETSALENTEAALFLQEFMGIMEQKERQTIIDDYINLFDFHEKVNLYLTSALDERQRGQVMADLKGFYAGAGLLMTDKELPDYLPLVLEYCSLSPKESQNLLARFRPALERLKQSLDEANSPYICLLKALFPTMD
ncbi:nitrate reductase molybdenum cofactor assembly chaperone [Desulfosporosinus sp. FKA]|uniref:nitrate reductase molybdenum cofactor assembly chaperone n=1 Tax=Desulfosporosinus sp. FKA TaxID=1969834 RepID=UPI0015563470|nr:nitrate reductase molybdenum cofactor assembly chaperone [Desulfosporosinus sp. FKA]